MHNSYLHSERVWWNIDHFDATSATKSRITTISTKMANIDQWLIISTQWLPRFLININNIFKSSYQYFKKITLYIFSQVIYWCTISIIYIVHGKRYITQFKGEALTNVCTRLVAILRHRTSAKFRIEPGKTNRSGITTWNQNQANTCFEP